MPRTARALSAAVLAGAALGVFAPPASAEPTVEVSPSTVAGGARVTVSVSCDATSGTPPATIDAVSQAFEEGTVELSLVTGADDGESGPAYLGTAKIVPAENFEGDPDATGEDSGWTVDGTCPAEPGAEGEPWSAPLTVSHAGNSGSGPSTLTSTSESTSEREAESGSEREAESESESEPKSTSASAATDWCTESDAASCEGGEDGPGSGHTTDPCAESYSDSCDEGAGSARPVHPPSHAVPPSHEVPPSHGRSHWCADRHATPCGGAAVQHGVRAGRGGAFTDSVPALVAGGLLIAGAAGAAVHRLRHRDTGSHG